MYYKFHERAQTFLPVKQNFDFGSIKISTCGHLEIIWFWSDKTEVEL